MTCLNGLRWGAHEVQLDGLVESEGEDLALYVAQLCRQSLADTPRAIANLLRITETFNPRSAFGLTELWNAIDTWRIGRRWGRRLSA